jgi:hypothetical protein
MGVLIKDQQRWWTNPYSWIPFKCDHCLPGLRCINEFNDAIGRYLFVPRQFAADYLGVQANAIATYITFNGTANAASGKIGKEKAGREMVVESHDTDASRFHELGHAVGLGHEYFHERWPYKPILLGWCNCACPAEMSHCQAYMGLHPTITFGKYKGKLGYLTAVDKYTSRAGSGYDPNSIMDYTLETLGFEDTDFATHVVPQNGRRAAVERRGYMDD